VDFLGFQAESNDIAMNQKSKQVGCGQFGCVLSTLILFFMLCLGAFVGPVTPPAQSDSYQAGHQIGFMDGNMGYNGGRMKPSSNQVNASARRTSSMTQFKDVAAKMTGYADGWSAK
jgi:hypothetical protein